MKLSIFLGLMVGLCSTTEFGQAKRTQYPKTDKQNTILAEVVKKMAEPRVCGAPELAGKEVYSGTVIKRQFDESELRLSGFVLRDKNDHRTFINIDTDYVGGIARSASSDLADFLIKGRPIKVWVYRCRFILYAYRISSP